MRILVVASLTVAVSVMLAVANGMSLVYAQERGYTSLDVRAEVTDVSRERGTSTDRWTFAVAIANTGTESLLVDVGYLYLDDGSRAPTDCVMDRLELRPGHTGGLVGCFRTDSELEPVSIDFVGSSNDGDPIPVHVLPFVRGECDALGVVSCQSVQGIAGIIRETGQGNFTIMPPAPPDQAHTAPALLAQAVYNWAENKLVLNFTEKINPFAVEMDRIRIAGAVCSLTLSRDEYDAHAPDLRSITLKLSEESRATLASMTHPHVYVEYGALAALNWTRYSLSDAPLSVDVPAPEVQPCVITYGFGEPPATWLEMAGLNATYAQVVRQAVSYGFEAWAALNPGLLFAEAEESPVIEISLIESEEYDGWACFDCLGYDALIAVVVSSTDCNGDLVFYGPNRIRNTIAHEFGHNIGLEHHPNGTHLMWGGDDFVQDPFDTRGYIIPELLPEWLEGEEDLVNRLYLLDMELAKLEIEHEEMVAEAKLFADRHATGGDGDKARFETDSMLNKYEEMLDKINAHKEAYGTLADEQAAVTREVNCMYGITEQPGPETGFGAGDRLAGGFAPARLFESG